MLGVASFVAIALTLVSAKPLADSLVVLERRDAVPQGFAQSGAAPAEQVLNLKVNLVQNDLAGLENALYEASTPGSAKYGQWLSKDEVHYPSGYIVSSHLLVCRSRLLRVPRMKPPPPCPNGCRKMTLSSRPSPMLEIGFLSLFPSPRRMSSSMPTSLSLRTLKAGRNPFELLNTPSLRRSNLTSSSSRLRPRKPTSHCPYDPQLTPSLKFCSPPSEIAVQEDQHACTYSCCRCRRLQQ